MSVIGGAGEDTLWISTGVLDSLYTLPVLNFSDWADSDLVVFAARGTSGSDLSVGPHDARVLVLGGSGDDTLTGDISPDSLNGGVLMF